MIKNFFKIHSYNYKQSDKNFFNLKIFKIDDHHKKNSTLYKNIVFFKQKKKIISFNEKSLIKNLWVNAGFYIFKKKIFDYIPKQNSIFESQVLTKVAKKNLLISFKHKDFWKCMDTIKDKNELNDIWFDSKPTPWKIW